MVEATPGMVEMARRVAARHRQSHSLPEDVGKEAEAWLRAISSWLLENDYDMVLPSGVLDTDPLDIADRLAALTAPPTSGERMREALAKWTETHFFVDYDEEGEPRRYTQDEAVKRASMSGGDVQQAVQATFAALNEGAE